MLALGLQELLLLHCPLGSSVVPVAVDEDDASDTQLDTRWPKSTLQLVLAGQPLRRRMEIKTALAGEIQFFWTRASFVWCYIWLECALQTLHATANCSGSCVKGACSRMEWAAAIQHTSRPSRPWRVRCAKMRVCRQGQCVDNDGDMWVSRLRRQQGLTAAVSCLGCWVGGAAEAALHGTAGRLVISCC